MIKGDLFLKMMGEYEKEISLLKTEINNKKDVTICCNRAELFSTLQQAREDNKEADKLLKKLKALQKEKELFVLTTTGHRL